jgi:hypothetical protein
MALLTWLLLPTPFQPYVTSWISMRGRTSIIWTKLDFSIGCRYYKFIFVYCKCLNMI